MFKIVAYSNMATSTPEATAACALFLTLSITMASSGRQISKLKFIPTHLFEINYGSKRLSLLAIELESAQNIDFDAIVK